MKLELFTLSILGIKASCVVLLEGRDACSTNDLALPSDGMQSTNGIYFGFLPDDTTDEGVTMATINNKSGKNASTYGENSQITQLPYDGSQLLKVLEDVVEFGAVFVPTIMPHNVPFSDVTSEVAGQILSVLERLMLQSVKVWLRFAHEMNWYAGKGQIYAGGSMANDSKIFMFWNPDYDTVDNLNPWWPGADYVDIFGMDNYAPPGTSFETTYGDFYYGFAEFYNKHFAIAETGVINGSDVASKEEWLSQLVSADTSAYPCYVSASWFEFLKTDFDYRLVLGQSEDTIEQTISHFK